MRTIWEYEIAITDEQLVDMPKDAEILSVQIQGDTPCLWAMVDSENHLKTRAITVIGTGNPINELHQLKYIGTCQMRGVLVFHFFERLN